MLFSFRGIKEVVFVMVVFGIEQNSSSTLQFMFLMLVNFQWYFFLSLVKIFDNLLAESFKLGMTNVKLVL